MIYSLRSETITPLCTAQSEIEKVFNIKHFSGLLTIELNDDVRTVTAPIISRLFTPHQLSTPFMLLQCYVTNRGIKIKQISDDSRKGSAENDFQIVS